MNSCSCMAKPATPAAKLGPNNSVSDAVYNTKSYLTQTYTKGDQTIVDKNIKYYVVPASDNQSYFLRYKLSTISARDLLLLKDGTIYVVDVDNHPGLAEYNDKYAFDITSVSDSELLKEKNVVKGG